MDPRKALLDWIERDRDRLIDFYQGFIRAKSPNPPGDTREAVAHISSFLDAAAVDEFIIHVIPHIIGEGIPLALQQHRDLPLKLLSCRTFPDGVVRLHYSIGSA